MCKRLAQALGGNIDATSVYGEGSQIRFWVKNEAVLREEENPFSSHSPETRTKATTQAIFCRSSHGQFPTGDVMSPLSEMTAPHTLTNCPCAPVLLVDDDSLNLFVLQSYLKSVNLHGDQVRLSVTTPKAFNGQEALDLVKARAAQQCCQGYKLIFMDINMPIMDGVAAAKHMTAMMAKSIIPSTPIIAVTAAEDIASVKSTLAAAGFSMFVQKPMTKGKFLQIAQKHQLL